MSEQTEAEADSEPAGLLPHLIFYVGVSKSGAEVEVL